MATRWKGMLAPIGIATGDGRRYLAFTHRDVPFALKWQRYDEQGHDTSVIVGRVTSVDIRPAAVWAEGEFFDDAGDDMPRLREDVAEAMHLAGKGVLGPSVDLDDLEASVVVKGTDIDFFDNGDPATEPELLVTTARIGAGTLVSLPAYAETSHPFELQAETEEECPEGQRKNDDGECVPEDEADEAEEAAIDNLVASVIGSTSLPIGDRDKSWDGSGATRRMLESGASTARRGHLYIDPDGDPETAAAYKLPFADLVNGNLQIIPKGVAAAAGGRGVNAAHIPDSEKATIRNKICRMYGRIKSKFDDWPDCPFSGDSASSASVEALIASVTQNGHLPAPDTFDNPELVGPTSITYRSDGYVYGHLALNDTCHAGFKDICVTPPLSTTDFGWFHRYPVETDEGIVWTGRLTAGGWHAPLHKSMTAAIDDYDEKVTAAHVVAGTDEFGIWIAGQMEENIDEATMAILSRRKISGDWRETKDGLELVEILALQPGPKALAEPGFPVATHLSAGRQTALVACLGPDPEGASTTDPIDYDKLASMTAKIVQDTIASEIEAPKRRAELAAVLEADARQELETVTKVTTATGG